MSYDYYYGGVDRDNHPHGRGSMHWGESVRFEGRFSRGNRVGKGTLYFGDGSYLTGSYKDDTIHGLGRYVFSDGSELVGMFVDGEMNGLVRKFSPEGDFVFYGKYRDNLPFGEVCSYDEWGGMVCGIVNNKGELTGDNISYVYPDKKHALTGLFRDGMLVKAVPSLVQDYNKETRCYHCKQTAKTSISYDLSTKLRISKFPMESDHYEQYYVYVSSSLIAGAGEGLFAKRMLSPHQVISFYNGIRVSHDIVNKRSWLENANTISLDDYVVIDVPVEYNQLLTYCASLAHKANHSSQPNSYYDKFTHPRFGRIKCIRAAREISPREEITVNYEYIHVNTDNETDLPVWYTQANSAVIIS
ncbi:hypothetical protein LOD99_12764 [Oopsacas minuta]|uniref:Histone-lysine N-methyltransferase SETD7 n=1 Tax=Oopsacas minuta TaxID=111878 RepID=A0AAV7JD89_9METZ|nr:hypothetical protein LOD99_12764 [Oopsacas minuta]